MANTVVFTAVDGYALSLPLDWALEHKAVVASRINDEPVANVMGSANQLWMAGVPAKYFIRDIVAIDFLELDEPPAPPSFVSTERDYVNRPNIGMRGPFTCFVGERMTFSGWADDYDKRIVAVELSLDGGKSWNILKTPDCDSQRLMSWQFAYTPQEVGTYLLKARAVNEDGKKSPICAECQFEVWEKQFAGRV